MGDVKNLTHIYLKIRIEFQSLCRFKTYTLKTESHSTDTEVQKTAQQQNNHILEPAAIQSKLLLQ